MSRLVQFPPPLYRPDPADTLRWQRQVRRKQAWWAFRRRLARVPRWLWVTLAVSAGGWFL
jgi:hypothetical protein